ncbi:hypothetical protein PM082_003444 [Marasmius tenuissimus]|nr:hypothetical protein PM082_003444 [Marasmius tenuissimus]
MQGSSDAKPFQAPGPFQCLDRHNLISPFNHMAYHRSLSKYLHGLKCASQHRTRIRTKLISGGKEDETRTIIILHRHLPVDHVCLSPM